MQHGVEIHAAWRAQKSGSRAVILTLPPHSCKHLASYISSLMNTTVWGVKQQKCIFS